MKKNDLALEAKFHRITAKNRTRIADYELVMSEEELRQCASGRKLLASVIRERRRTKRYVMFAQNIGQSAAAIQEQIFSNLLPSDKSTVAPISNA